MQEQYEEPISQKFLNLECNFTELKDIQVLAAVVYGRMIQMETIVKYADPKSKVYSESVDKLMYLYETCLRDRLKDYPTNTFVDREEEIKRIEQALLNKYKPNQNGTIKSNPDQTFKKGPDMSETD